MNIRSSHVAWIAKGAWLIACGLSLIGFVVCRSNVEAQDFLVVAMQVLSFPLGLLATPLILITGFLAQMISPLGSLLTWFGDYVMVWFWFFVLGFVQWFLIVPGVIWMVRKLFSGRAR